MRHDEKFEEKVTLHNVTLQANQIQRVLTNFFVPGHALITSILFFHFLSRNHKKLKKNNAARNHYFTSRSMWQSKYVSSVI